MSAETTYYVEVPVLSYTWVKVMAITADDAREKYPNAREILHWSQVELEADDGIM